MKHTMIFRHFNKIFTPFFILSISAILAIMAISCGKEKKEEAVKKEPTVTIENLKTAYAKEMNRVKMYNLFVERARKDKMKQIEKLYLAIRRSEELHAQRISELLANHGIQPPQPADEKITVGTTLQTLKMALSMEEIEYGSMYPNLIRTADAEKYEDALKQFSNIQDADSKHGELLRYAISQNGKIPVVKYLVCPKCGYIVDIKNVQECPTCKTKISEFEAF